MSEKEEKTRKAFVMAKQKLNQLMSKVSLHHKHMSQCMFMYSFIPGTLSSDIGNLLVSYYVPHSSFFFLRLFPFQGLPQRITVFHFPIFCIFYFDSNYLHVLFHCIHISPISFLIKEQYPVAAALTYKPMYFTTFIFV